MPNVLSPRDLVSRPDNMDETVPHTQEMSFFVTANISVNKAACKMTINGF